MFGKDNKGVIIKETQVLPLLGVAAAAAVSVSGPGITDDYRIIKSELHASLEGLTAGEGNNLILGIANQDLSDAAIAASLVIDGPLNAADRDKAEAAGRFTRMLSGSNQMPDGGTIRHFAGDKGGPLIEKTIRWTFTKGIGWKWFIFNNDGSAITTGSNLRLIATHYGVWVN